MGDDEYRIRIIKGHDIFLFTCKYRNQSRFFVDVAFVMGADQVIIERMK